jgi:hypothetical protein
MENIETNVSETVENIVTENSTDNVQDNTNNTQQEEKLIPQSQLEDIINKKYAQWAKKAEDEKQKAMIEAKEAEKLEKMSASERYEKKLADLEKKLEEKEKAESRKDLTNTTLKELSVRGIDSDFLEFVLGDNADETKEKLDLFENKLNAMVEAKVTSQVQDRLRGNAPKTSTIPQTKSSFTLDDIKTMTPEQINANWDTISKIKFNQ